MARAVLAGLLHPAWRRMIDEDVLGIPLDLSLMTFDEEREVRAVALQRAIRIVPATA